MHMWRSRLGFLILFSCGVLASAADWPQWRGPNRDGKSLETGLLASWPAGGPRLVWKAQGLGEGYSSFAVVGGRLYTQGQQGNQQFVLAIDVNTGKQLWKTPSGRAYGNDRGNGPRGTPTIDGNRLYALAADGMLLCLETANRQAYLGIQYRPEVRRQRSAMGIQRIAAGGWRSRHRHARRARRSGCGAEQGYRRSPLEVAE